MVQKIIPSETKYLFKNVVTDHGVVVQNTYYTALDAVDVEVIGAAVKVTVADETVNFRVTVDGEVMVPSSQNLLFASNFLTALAGIYINCIGPVPQGIAPTTSQVNIGYTNAWCRGHSIRIEVRKTTAAGASHLISQVIYLQRC